MMRRGALLVSVLATILIAGGLIVRVRDHHQHRASSSLDAGVPLSVVVRWDVPSVHADVAVSRRRRLLAEPHRANVKQQNAASSAPSAAIRPDDDADARSMANAVSVLQLDSVVAPSVIQDFTQYAEAVERAGVSLVASADDEADDDECFALERLFKALAVDPHTLPRIISAAVEFRFMCWERYCSAGSDGSDDDTHHHGVTQGTASQHHQHQEDVEHHRSIINLRDTPARPLDEEDDAALEEFVEHHSGLHVFAECYVNKVSRAHVQATRAVDQHAGRMDAIANTDYHATARTVRVRETVRRGRGEADALPRVTLHGWRLRQHQREQRAIHHQSAAGDLSSRDEDDGQQHNDVKSITLQQFEQVMVECLENTANQLMLNDTELGALIVEQLECISWTPRNILWPVFNYWYAILKWLWDMGYLYGTSGWIALQDWVPPTNVFDFITPGVYGWAGWIKNAMYTNTDFILAANVQHIWDTLQDDRVAQVDKLNAIFMELANSEATISALLLEGNFTGAVNLFVRIAI